MRDELRKNKTVNNSRYDLRSGRNLPVSMSQFYNQQFLKTKIPVHREVGWEAGTQR